MNLPRFCRRVKRAGIEDVAERTLIENIILPDKTHLAAIGVGGPMPPQYADAMSRSIDAYDQP